MPAGALRNRQDSAVRDGGVPLLPLAVAHTATSLGTRAGAVRKRQVGNRNSNRTGRHRAGQGRRLNKYIYINTHTHMCSIKKGGASAARCRPGPCERGKTPQCARGSSALTPSGRTYRQQSRHACRGLAKEASGQQEQQQDREAQGGAGQAIEYIYIYIYIWRFLSCSP